MPVNVYVSAALVSDQLSIKILNFDGAGNDYLLATSNKGAGINLMVGKEWWVSDDWGIGVAGAFRTSTVEDTDDNTKFAINGFNIVFSATYN